ncbi:MAG TPA: hypothetical protein PLC76_13045 [Saprospiraceae bacterium]|jgi:hypothetical protein|nr:hypothetical protein [Candidatus Parvibacillus calidus]MBX2936621.1 hypothetical protein [Saprospiraceae bacterium]MBX7178086.1 hypothetical protein [Saprospiraceae bacterium]MCB0591197.1 hypothetical protein [Saprospiraceae bacterium]MCC7147839.1 hypothetical protein [Saprospiraceae bacterium]
MKFKFGGSKVDHIDKFVDTLWWIVSFKPERVRAYIAICFMAVQGYYNTGPIYSIIQ